MGKKDLLSVSDSKSHAALIKTLTAATAEHARKELPDPTKSPLVKKMLQGIRRKHGRPVEKPAAFLLKDLDLSVKYLNKQNKLSAIRDKALLLVGFHAACRRSELSAMRWENIYFLDEGMVIHFIRSKTDQYATGQSCSIPVGFVLHRCPIQALLDWRKASGKHNVC